MTENSLRVLVRARPMNARETREGAQKCVEFYETTGQLVINDSATFAYDTVFPDTVDQETVYEKTALPLLDRIFKGFNATVLAYGQTGSGKTYTMGTEDNDGTDEMRRGIIPRLVHDLFQRIMRTEVPESFNVTVSMYEVYGDNVYDLLRPDKVKLNVHGDARNCTIVNLTAVPVIDLKGALKQLAIGCHYRTKAETAMNSMSSRSHAVFTVNVEKNSTADDGCAFSAKLQLVDLAGSERLKKTEAEGCRKKEGININSGLLILSQVISALATKQKHIPYRNSVITRVLQDSLGGNSYTVFLACISLADTNSAETLNTLRYADRAKQIKNKPIVNKNPKIEEIAVLQAQIEKLQKENTDLRRGTPTVDTKYNEMATAAEIMSLKDEVARKSEEIRERAIKQSACIVRINALSQRSGQLEEDKVKLSSIISDVRNVIVNEKMLDTSDLVESIGHIIGDHSNLLEEDQNETVASVSDYIIDHNNNNIERLPELQAELDDLELQITIKKKDREKDLETQREFLEAMKPRETEKSHLEIRIEELESEIRKLQDQIKKGRTATKLAEERRKKLKELELQHSLNKKALSEFKKLQETSIRLKNAFQKTENELKELKTQRTHLLKVQRIEASKFYEFKKKHEIEISQMNTMTKKHEVQAARQKIADEQELAVFEKRLAESTRVNKMLRQLNRKRGTLTIAPDISALQSMIGEDLELEATAHRCRLMCDELFRQREELTDRINQLESQNFGRVTTRRPLKGVEEFEEKRRKQLDDLRSSLEKVKKEIKDSLSNETILKSHERTRKWEKVPKEYRPLVETVYGHAVSHVKKEVDLDVELTRAKTEFAAKIEEMRSLEDKGKRDIESMRARYKDLIQGFEDAKSDLHHKIVYLLQLIKTDSVDENALEKLEFLKDQFCDVEQDIEKSSFMCLKSPPPKREFKRARRMCRDNSNRSCENSHDKNNSIERIDESGEIDLSESNKEMSIEEEDSNATFIVKRSSSLEDPDATFVVHRGSPPPKSRRTDVGARHN